MGSDCSYIQLNPVPGAGAQIAGITTKPKEDKMDKTKLKTYLERIFALEDEKKELARDIKKVYTDAELDGVNSTELKMAVKLAKMTRRERDAMESVAAVID